ETDAWITDRLSFSGDGIENYFHQWSTFSEYHGVKSDALKEAGAKSRGYLYWDIASALLKVNVTIIEAGVDDLGFFHGESSMFLDASDVVRTDFGNSG
ncbi:MAG: hypothetical protein MMC23_003772, partial [Stictis urceolatum]|nr:hypothetical protein [Stictis urceolata]